MTRVRGWCPSAHRPMMSGDGLLVRVKPRMGRLSGDCVSTVCDLAERFGSGLIEVTARANLQLRGVAETDHPALLADLVQAGLVEPDPDREGARNITVTPFWMRGDLADRLYDPVAEVLARVDLPAKMGVVLDTGPAPVLRGVSGDFRFETMDRGALLLRAEGADLGLEVAEGDAPRALADMIGWFLDTGGVEAGRMGRHLLQRALPAEYQKVQPHPFANRTFANRPGPGARDGGRLFGVPFGSTDAATLRALMAATGAAALRVTPWRMLFLEGASPADVPGILSNPDPVMTASACPGAPLCSQATVSTRDLARDLARVFDGTLHVSGCAKACARPSPAALTLVGRDGRFDLVRDGRAGDTPVETGLTADDLRMREF
ncbi:MAG: cobalamin biosynthesis protein CobG [Pseudomonadota bacterium]